MDEAEALGEGGTALEPDIETGLVQGPHAVSHPVVLLHQRGAYPHLPGDDTEQAFEVGILMNEEHGHLPGSPEARQYSTSARVA